MAPEQLRGEAVDHRTDVFGFCATLYEMLHGVRPLAVVSAGGVRHQALAPAPEAPPAGSRVPGWLHRLALRGLAPDAAARPPSMAALADALLAPPGRAWRRVLLAATGAAAVVAAFWGGNYVAASPERRCQLGAGVIEGDWNDRARLAVRRLFERAGQAPAWTIAERHLARYARGWRDTYRENCAATFGDARQSSDVFDLRMACLAGRRVALQTFVAALPSVPAHKLASIATGAAALPDLADCDATARPGLKALPADPGLRKRLAEVDATIEQAVVKTILGDYAGAARLATGAVAAARKLGYEPLVARALAQAANIERRRGGVGQSAGGAETEYDRSAQMLEESFVLAERGHDDLRRAGTASEMIIAELERGRHLEAEKWARLGDAILTRLGNPAEQRASLAASVGWLRLELGQRKEAAEAFTRATELFRRVRPSDDPELVAPRIGACRARESQEDRNRCYRELLPLARSIFGPDHDHVGIILTGLADGLMNDARTRAEACDLFREVLRLAERNQEPTSQRRYDAMGNLANCLHLQGELGEARRLYEQALAGSQAPSATRARAFWRAEFAVFLADTGDFKEALKHARAALTDRTALYGESHEEVLESRTSVANILHDAGSPAQALRELDRAIAAGQRATSPGLQLAHLHDRRGLLLTHSLKRFRDARRDHQAALAIQDRLQIPEAERHRSLYGLGAAELGLELARPAITHLERAHEVEAQGGVSPKIHADTAFALARALVLAGQQRARACKLARAALAPYREAGAKRRIELRQLERWLQRQSCPL